MSNKYCGRPTTFKDVPCNHMTKLMIVKTKVSAAFSPYVLVRKMRMKVMTSSNDEERDDKEDD